MSKTRIQNQTNGIITGEKQKTPEKMRAYNYKDEKSNDFIYNHFP